MSQISQLGDNARDRRGSDFVQLTSGKVSGTVESATRGLLHRAVVLSGAPITAFPHHEFSDLARDYFQMLGVRAGDADALMRLSIDAVRKASPSAPEFVVKYRERYGALGRAHFGAFGIVTGTDLFPTDPCTALREKHRAGFDLLIGTCATSRAPGPYASQGRTAS